MEKIIDILEYIPYGKENAITRTTLCMITGLNDRSMRESINRARKRAVVINLSDGSGYYRPTDNEVTEVIRFKKQEESRAKDVFSNLQPVRKFLQNAKKTG